MTRVLLALAGVWLCVMGAVVHRHVSWLGGNRLPWGLVLVLLSTLAVAMAADVLLPLGSAYLGLGWTCSIALLQSGGSGSYLVAADTAGWLFMIGGLAVIGVVVITSKHRSR